MSDYSSMLLKRDSGPKKVQIEKKETDEINIDSFALLLAINPTWSNLMPETCCGAIKQ